MKLKTRAFNIINYKDYMIKRTLLSFVGLSFYFLIKAQPTPNPLIASGDVIDAAFAFEQEEQYNRAIDTLMTIDESDTNYVYSLVELSAAYYYDKKYEKAIETANKALSEPSKFKLRLSLIKGNTYDAWGYPDSAIMVYDEAAKHYPNQYLLHYNKGITYVNQKKYELAIKAFQESILNNPFHSSSHLMLGRISALMGHYSHALLSMGTFFMLEPNSDRSNKQLVFINDFVNNALGAEYEKIDPIVDNSAFEEADQMLKSGVAFNNKFKQVIEFNAPIAKQAQFLFDIIEYDPNSNDFWMKHYVTMLLDVKKKGFIVPYLLKVLYSVPDKGIAKEIKKEDQSIKELNVLLGQHLGKISKKRTLNVKGTEGVYDLFYDEDNYLVSIGNYKNDDKTKTGYWRFFYNNGELSAEGNYDDNGKLTGKWNNYNKNGQLSYIENYTNGELNGEYIGYYESGNVRYRATYKDNMVQGKVTYYFDCDGISSEVSYVNNKKNGKGVSYFRNGNVFEEYNYADDSLQGENRGYYYNGKLKWVSLYQNNKINGKSVNYFENGKVQSETNYSNGNYDGEFVTYYKNGLPNYKGVYKNGIITGTYYEYYENGKVNQSTEYDEKGNVSGSQKGYDKDGTLYYIFGYKKGKLKELAYFDKQGKEIYKQSISSGTTKVKGFYPDGSLFSEGQYVDGMPEGQWIYYYKSGTIQLMKNYSEGNLHGQYTAYYKSGRKSISCIYKNNDYDGYYVKYNSYGNKESEGWYVDGQKEGNWFFYFSNGKLSNKTYFLHNNATGFEYDYAPDSMLKFKTKYENGFSKRIEQFGNDGKKFKTTVFDGNSDYALYYPDGKLRAKGVFKCNVLSGKYTFFRKDGSLSSEFNYNNDVKDGKCVIYNSNGKLKKEGSYEFGEMTGFWKYYNYDGILIKSGYFNEGMYDSTWTKYYENGNVRELSSYHNDQIKDTSYYYDAYGRLMCKIFFDDEGIKGLQYESVKGWVNVKIGLKDSGTYVCYYKDGNKSAELSLKDGEFFGKQIYYYHNGKKYREFTFNYGGYENDFIEYYENGNIKFQESYQFGDQEGISKYYRQDGSLERSEEYKSDKEHGIFNYYDETGKIVKVEKYWGGMLLN